MSKVYVLLEHEYSYSGHDDENDPLQGHGVTVVSIHRTVRAANRALLERMDVEEDGLEDRVPFPGWVNYSNRGGLDVCDHPDNNTMTRLWVVEELVEDDESEDEDEDEDDDENHEEDDSDGVEIDEHRSAPPAKRQRNN